MSDSVYISAYDGKRHYILRPSDISMLYHEDGGLVVDVWMKSGAHHEIWFEEASRARCAFEDIDQAWAGDDDD